MGNNLGASLRLEDRPFSPIIRVLGLLDSHSLYPWTSPPQMSSSKGLHFLLPVVFSEDVIFREGSVVEGVPSGTAPASVDELDAGFELPPFEHPERQACMRRGKSVVPPPKALSAQVAFLLHTPFLLCNTI